MNPSKNENEKEDEIMEEAINDLNLAINENNEQNNPQNNEYIQNEQINQNQNFHIEENKNNKNDFQNENNQENENEEILINNGEYNINDFDNMKMFNNEEYYQGEEMEGEQNEEGEGEQDFGEEIDINQMNQFQGEDEEEYADINEIHDINDFNGINNINYNKRENFKNENNENDEYEYNIDDMNKINDNLNNNIDNDNMENADNDMNNYIDNNMNNNMNMNMNNNFNNNMNHNFNINYANSNSNSMNFFNLNNINNNNMNNNMNMNYTPDNNAGNNFNMNNNNLQALNSKTFQNINRNSIINDQIPPLIGLKNIGATCFMNAILQCLSQIGKLSKYFLAEKNRDLIINNNIARANRNALQLSPSYLELIQHLWNASEPEGAYSPNNFMNKVEQMNDLFKLGQAGDSKDFIIFILEQLHTELKRPCRNYQPYYSHIEINQYDRENAFNHFFDEFRKELSIISDLFFGISETRNECIKCRNEFRQKGQNGPICYNYQIFNNIIFPLEEVRKMKIQNNQNNINLKKDMVSLDDCFIYYQRPELFTGENKNFCNKCNTLYDSNYTSLIYSFPIILIIILNRGKNNKYKIKLDFNEEIDITKYAKAKKTNDKLIYNLIGVVTHIGESGQYAHFMAHCKSSINNTWYRFDDKNVYRINNVYNDVINFETPYILFYQKKGQNFQ